jgi:photosystem II stability/assembly factor-like uncharacterized protein
MIMIKNYHFLLSLLMFISFSSYSQKKKTGNEVTKTQTTLDSNFIKSLQYRHIGPFRGGRSAAVTGVEGNPRLFYMGSTGGGVWKSTDAGNSWKNISDGYFGGSIGAVAVSQSDPNVIYVGGGEKTVRGNVSHGYGVFKSVDAGKSWMKMGLEDTRQIPRIRIHPTNSDIVYVAALGHLFGANKERGVFKSIDGGKTWKNTLFVNDTVGAVDLILDSNNPRIMFASTWNVKRTPYSLESGGAGSALWKSMDGGETWTNLSTNEGLPKGTWGIVGVTISPKNSERIWAIIENEDGGLYRSDDGGKTWKKVNSDRNLRQRAWYYSRIYADPQNEDRIYALNVDFWRSNDGGKTFESIETPHGDHHDLWINPSDNQNMIIGDDGGAQVTLDGGKSWTTYFNQPTSQFYRVTTDNHFPYRIYVAQQDNSTLRILHRTNSYGGIEERDWEETAGGESGHIAPDPKNNDIVYGGSYGGFLTRYNHKTNEVRAVNVYPNDPMGAGAKASKYRFQWNFPIMFSPNDPNTLYAAGNVLFKTTNEGQNWEAISPDLTRNDTTKMESSGGLITKDNTSVEYYGTIFAMTESYHEKNVIWAGSDDGLLHVTKDGGKTWENVTPPSTICPKWVMFNSIDIHPFEKGGVYVAATLYKSDDFKPYLFKTTDYGKTWTKIVNGIDQQHFTRVIRADNKSKGLLYAGTESGMYISFDDGNYWQPFQLNLPIVPITDLTIKDSDLIVATQGRSIWILDDLSPIHQYSTEISNKSFSLLTPRQTWRMSGGKGGNGTGENPENGVWVHYYLKDTAKISDKVRLDILSMDDKLIRSFSTGYKDTELKKNTQLGKLSIKKGLNRFAWDMRYANAQGFDGMILWSRGTRGPLAIPNKYKAKLVMGSDSSIVEFDIIKDPRNSSSQEDLVAQFDFLWEVRNKLHETHEAIIDIREIKKQVSSWKEKFDKTQHKALIESADQLTKKLSKIEQELYQVKNQSPQDPLNYPIKLNDKLGSVGNLTSYGSFRPTDQAIVVKNELVKLINEQLNQYKEVVSNLLPAFNQAVKEANIPPIKID